MILRPLFFISLVDPFGKTAKALRGYWPQPER